MTFSISIHALREEGDLWALVTKAVAKPFLSTPSVRRATHLAPPGCPVCVISIHALREEGDLPAAHALCGSPISIHALREEGDEPLDLIFPPGENFYPRPP